jgi:hypothetical protein
MFRERHWRRTLSGRCIVTKVGFVVGLAILAGATPLLAQNDQARLALDKLVVSGYWALSVCGNWRVTFRFDNGHAVDVDYMDYH